MTGRERSALKSNKSSILAAGDLEYGAAQCNSGISGLMIEW